MMAGYHRVVAAAGAWGTVECVRRRNGSVPAREFLESLRGDAAVFFALFDEMASDGRTTNPDRFSHEMGRIYGFKHKIGNRQVRFACFQDSNRWILTHGFFKPGAQRRLGVWPQRELKRANRLMAEYLAQLQ